MALSWNTRMSMSPLRGRAASNSAFRKTFQSISKPYRYQINNDLIKDEQADEIMARAYAKSVIKNMQVVKKKGGEIELVQGVPSKSGKVLEFNEKNVIALLLTLPEFFKDIQDQAGSIGTFTRESEEDEVKN